jgi:hypothetical protein
MWRCSPMTLILVHQDWNYISVAFRNLDPKFKFFSDIGPRWPLVAISLPFPDHFRLFWSPPLALESPCRNHRPRCRAPRDSGGGEDPTVALWPAVGPVAPKEHT